MFKRNMNLSSAQCTIRTVPNVFKKYLDESDMFM